MTNPNARGEHYQASQIAIEHMDEFMGAVAALKEVTEEALNKTVNAVGDTPSQAGQNAKAWLAEIKDNRIDEILRLGSQIIVELTAYQNGI